MQSVRRFVWSGWLLLMELDVTGQPPEEEFTVVRKYTWGLDLAGLNGARNSLEAAGGIGGLLAVEQAAFGSVPAGEYLYTHDGNGNVVQVLDRTATGVQSAIVTQYEYDPYGNVVRPDPDGDGNWVEHAEPFGLENPFRFSLLHAADRSTAGPAGPALPVCRPSLAGSTCLLRT